MKIKFSILIVLLSLLLASCGNQLQIMPKADINLALATGEEGHGSQILEDVVIDVEKGTISFTTQSSSFVASAKSGSIAVTISSYTIDFFYADGTQIETATGASYRGNINLNVPAGWQCPEVEEEGDFISTSSSTCNVNTTGAVAATGPTVATNGFIPMSWDIVKKLWNESDSISRSGAYAMISVEGTDSNGYHFSKKMNPVTISFSVTYK